MYEPNWRSSSRLSAGQTPAVWVWREQRRFYSATKTGRRGRKRGGGEEDVLLLSNYVVHGLERVCYFFLCQYLVFALFSLPGKIDPPSTYCVSVCLFGRRRAYITWKKRGRVLQRGWGTPLLICLDHGYGAYYDNGAARQHSPSHLLPLKHCADSRYHTEAVDEGLPSIIRH